MKNQINTSEGNVQFITPDGKLMNVHPSHVYAVFNQDTVSFLLIAMPKSSGLAVFTSTAEDLLFNGETYTFEQLKTVIPEAFAEAGAQARCEIVDELPETGKTNTIYLVPKEEGEGYDEYIYLKDEQRWELVGDTSIEMKNYVKKVDFNSYSAATEIVINSISGAIDTETSNREAADSVISGAVDTLSTAIQNEAQRAQNAETELINKIDAVSGDAEDIQAELDVVSASLESEVSARTDADTVLSGAISSVTEDVVALSGDVTAHTSNTDIHVTAADKTAWADKYTKAGVDGIVSGLNDSIDAVSGAVADETARAISAETALHDEIENIDLSDYYTKSQTSGATELSTALSSKQNVLTAGENIVISGDVISAEAGNDVTELTQAEYDALVEAGTVDPDVLYIITDAAPINLNNYYQKSETSSKTEIEDAISAEATARANADTALSGAVDTALLAYINGAEYVSTAKTINFLNGETVIDSIDATDFIKDGMVSNVEISGGSLVIEFNTDAGKEDIVIPLTDIFDPSNYYTKSETSGKSEISTALASKQDTLSAGTGIDITSNVISVTGGVNVVQTTGTSTADVMSQDAVTTQLDGKGDAISLDMAGSPKKRVTFLLKRGGINGTTISFRDLTLGRGLVYGEEGYTTLSTSGLVETTAITTSITTASTDTQVPSAKAVNDSLALKLDTTAYTPTDLSNYYTKGETSGATEISTALSAKQGTLSAGTGVDITNDVISVTGGTGGKAVSGGTNISITTGETADTINCTLPITASSSAFQTISVGRNSGGGSYNTLIGPNARCGNNNEHNVFLVAQKSSNSSSGSYVNGANNVIIGSIKEGYTDFNIPSFTTSKSVVIGGGGISTDKDNSVAIGYLANVSGTTQTNINNQLKIDTSNQVYIYNKDNTEMICLQDQLGGGSSINVVQTTGSSSADVMSQDAVTTALSGKQDSLSNASTLSGISSSDVTSWNGAATNASTAITNLGGLKLQQVTQAEYDAITNKDASTLYVIVN